MFFICFSIFLFAKRNQIQDELYVSKIGTAYEDLNIERYISLINIPFFMSKRIIHVATYIFLKDYACF